MFDYQHLRALAAVIRRGSFDLAAAELSVTPSAISQRIKALEERLGTVLVRRGQPCTATETGARLVRHHEAVALLEQDLARELGPARPEGLPATVRIAVNADSLATWFLPALTETEGFLFDLVIDDQEHSHEALRRGEVLAAVTADADPVRGCETCALGVLRYVATASPAYMARWFPEGLTTARAARAPALVFNEKDGLQAAWVQRQFGQRIGLPEHRIASSHDFVRAALADMGWGMNPLPLVAEHLASGALVALATEPLDVPLYWQVSRMASGPLAPLTRAVTAAAEARLVR